MTTVPTYNTQDYERYAVRLHETSAAAKLSPKVHLPVVGGAA